MRWLFTQLIGKSAGSYGKEWKGRLMKNINFIMNCFVVLWFVLTFFNILFFIISIFFVFLYLDPRLILILFLSITQVVRCPSLERDWSSGDHVLAPGEVTPQIYTYSGRTKFESTWWAWIKIRMNVWISVKLKLKYI